MKIGEIINLLETFAPTELQESYDNSGLQVGDKNAEANKALVCLDVSENVIQEAIDKDCNLIISHHPLIFKGLKKITSNSFIERILIKAIKNNIAIYATHTNMDNVDEGVSKMMADKLSLKKIKVLSPKKDYLRKLVTFCPVDKAEEVRNALFVAGAGHIGNYDCCSYNVDGTGSFRALENSNPYVGEKRKIHFEKEIRIETIYPLHLESALIKILLEVHPYEEPAYDIYPLANTYNKAGSGMIGELESEIDEKEFLKKIKTIFKTGCIKHSKLLGGKIKKVAVCGGSGSFLIHDAIRMNANIFISADIKYHDFFEAENKIIIADVGHYESEQFIKELLLSIINKIFPKFAAQISEQDLNPVNYF